jgi:hypothetical protein
MLDLAISVNTDRNGTTIIETNHGVRLKSPKWPQDCEFQLVAFAPSARTCHVIASDQLTDDIRNALAALEDAGVSRQADWHRRLRRYATGAGGRSFRNNGPRASTKARGGRALMI